MQRESRGIIAVSIQSNNSMERGEVLWFRKIEGRRREEEKRKSGQ